MPCFRILTDRLYHRCESVVRCHRTSGREWLPLIRSGTPAPVLQVLYDAGVRQVSCFDLSQAPVIRDAGFTGVCVLEKPCDPRQAEEIAALAESMQVLTVIDHFVHAERLQRAAVDHRVTMKVLVEVDVSGLFSGIRAGKDAAELAVATHRLTGLAVAGFVFQPRDRFDLPAVDSDGDHAGRLRSTVLGTIEDLDAAGVSPEVIALMGDAMLPESLSRIPISHVIDPGVFPGPSAGGAATGNADSVMTVTATVVSRPALTTAVVRLGLEDLGTSRLIPDSLAPTGARVAATDEFHAALTVTGPARDLRIGDVVTFAVSASASAVRNARCQGSDQGY